MRSPSRAAEPASRTPASRHWLAPIFLLTFIALIAATARGADPIGPAAPLGTQWKQVFGDEFDGTSLNSSKWYPNRWFAATCAKGATASELQYFTSRPSNVSVSDGALHLTAEREAYTCPESSWAGTSAYTSGWVQSGGSRASDGSRRAPGFTIGLGYVEARVKLPAGKGLWPAVWMLQTYSDRKGTQQYPSRPEIDNLEARGDAPSIWHFAVHLDATDSKSDFGGPDTSAGWHTIGVWRKADRIEWYVDGQLAWTYAGSSIPSSSVRMYVILSLAVGGNWPGPPDASTPFPAEMLVDYVRAWEPAAIVPLNAPPTVALTAPTAGLTFSSSLNMAANASDDKGVSRVEFWVDSSRVATDYAAPYAYTWKPTGYVAYGAHTVSARAFDAQGLSSSSAVTTYRTR